MRRTVTFGQRLRALRISRDLRVCDMSAITGLSKYTIRMAELDQSNPTLLTMTCLADALGVSIDYLLGYYDSVVNIDELQRAMEFYRTAGYRVIHKEAQPAVDKLVEAAELLCKLSSGSKETDYDKV